MCKLNDGVEDVGHFLLNCQEFVHIRYTLMSNVSQKNSFDILSFKPKTIVKILLYGSKKYNNDTNTYILNETINFIKKSKRFDKVNGDVEI